MRGSMRGETSSWPLAIGPWLEATAEDTAEGGGATRAWVARAGVTALTPGDRSQGTGDRVRPAAAVAGEVFELSRACVTASQPASLLGISDLTGCGLSRRLCQIETKSCCR